jgi:molybdopterin synthase catalytic subunit
MIKEKTKAGIDIQLLDRPLKPQRCIDYVSHPAAGGIDVFIGTVRDHTKGKTVVRLDFEAYDKMAISEMRKIAEQIVERWPAYRVSIHHRVGSLQIGDIAVIIAVSTPHRKAAFEACQYAIDTLKETVPIWKKEIFEDGEVWVAAHP